MRVSFVMLYSAVLSVVKCVLPSSIKIDLSDAHCEKPDFVLILLRDLGSVILCNEEQLVNASSPIDVILDGMLMEDSLAQP